MTQHVLIAIPSYTGMVHVATMRSIIAELLVLTEAGIKVSLYDESGNAMIAHGRSLICAKFLATDATDLFFVDDDVVWETGAMLKLLRQPVDIVAAIYPKRSDPLGFHCRYVQDRKELMIHKDTRLLQVEGVPAGFTRITRNCIEKMILHYPEKRFADQYAPKGYAWALFDNLHEGDAYFGEDYSFCRRWIKMGGTVWVDPEIVMCHIGNKTFMGKFGDWLRERNK